MAEDPSKSFVSFERLHIEEQRDTAWKSTASTACFGMKGADGAGLLRNSNG